MALNNIVSPMIESKADLIKALSKGNKPKSEWRIGTEHEKFTFYRADNSPVPYQGENGIEALLKGIMEDNNWLPLLDEGNIIGLKCLNTGAAISLEPGGQFELSGAPLLNVHQTCAETATHLKMLSKIAEPMGIGFLGMGVAPTWGLDEIPLMPKSRYNIMKPYMEQVGTLGTSMMMRSCTVQVNLDFSSESDMVKKLRVSLALQPIATALFANSPFIDSKPNGYLSYRSHIWQHTDSDRTGMLPFAFENGMGFEQYVDYALDVPMYFVMRDNKYINVAGESFRDFLKGELPQLKGEKPTVQDWEDHISTIFPEVRLKQFLEMRGADGAPWAEICALPALWAGIFYDQTALDAAWDLVKNWSETERNYLRNNVPKTALDTEFRKGTVRDIAKQMVDISRSGLVARDQLNGEGMNETHHLAPLDYTLKTGNTLAQRMLKLYHSKWNGDISCVFTDAAY